MKNNYEIRGDVTAIFIVMKKDTFELLIDTSDLEILKKFPNKFSLNSTRNEYTYARGHWVVNGRQHSIYLHKLLIPTIKGYVVDHINGNKLDNRRKNLRVLSSSDNSQNRKGTAKHNTSGIQGVVERDGKWKAIISVKGKVIDYGTFINKTDAEYAVKKARSQNMPFSKEAEYSDLKSKENVPRATSKPRTNNKSGFRHVIYVKNKNKWRVAMRVNKKLMDFGYYSDLNEAARIAEEARNKYGIV